MVEASEVVGCTLMPIASVCRILVTTGLGCLFIAVLATYILDYICLLDGRSPV